MRATQPRYAYAPREVSARTARDVSTRTHLSSLPLGMTRVGVPQTDDEAAIVLDDLAAMAPAPAAVPAALAGTAATLVAAEGHGGDDEAEPAEPAHDRSRLL